MVCVSAGHGVCVFDEELVVLELVEVVAVGVLLPGLSFPYLCRKGIIILNEDHQV